MMIETKNIIGNRFDPRNTKKVIIHDGRFHADDMMFAALAMVAAEKCRNKVEIIRTSVLPEEYDAHTIVGDIGYGVYDHHTDLNGLPSAGVANSEEGTEPAACGLLYREIKDILFPGDSETKKVFDAFIDIIEHCDNTPDNNTFSDSVNYFTPVDDCDLEEAATEVIKYCRAVIIGFVEAHEKERSGKIWAVPRVCKDIVPGIPEKKDSRYWKATNQVKSRYRYVSFNNTMNMKLRSMDTYSLACGVLNQRRRQQWREEIERRDAAQVKEMERRLNEDWPKALSEMKYRTIVLDKYIVYGQFVKDIPALFIVLPSQRGGYTLNILKTSNGKYRFNPDLLTGFDGCSFIANDKRFLFFDTKEHAVEAAYAAGETVDRYIEKYGYYAYRDIYGGCAKEYTNEFFQDLISEDISLNMFVRENIDNPNEMTIEDMRKLQVAVCNNNYAIHSFCLRLVFNGEFMKWDFDRSVTDIQGLNFASLVKRLHNQKKWDFGLNEFMNSPYGSGVWNIIHPQNG